MTGIIFKRCLHAATGDRQARFPDATASGDRERAKMPDVCLGGVEGREFVGRPPCKQRGLLAGTFKRRLPLAEAGAN